MHHRVRQLMTNGPGNPIPGVGMSLRPEFYSGRSLSSADLGVERLVKIYKGLQALESYVLPEGASRAFVLMVKQVPVLTATPFLRAFHQLDANGWTWPEESEVDPSSIELGNNPHNQEAVAIASLISALSGPHTEMEQAAEKMMSDMQKHRFISQTDCQDLLDDRPNTDRPRDPYMGY